MDASVDECVIPGRVAEQDGELGVVDAGETIVCATIDVGTPDSLSTLLTHESLDRLDLRPGSRVVASFKATATRAIATD